MKESAIVRRKMWDCVWSAAGLRKSDDAWGFWEYAPIIFTCPTFLNHSASMVIVLSCCNGLIVLGEYPYFSLH